MFLKIGVLKNLPIFIGKHLCWGLFLTKLQAKAKKRTPTHFSSGEYCGIFTNSFITELLRWLLLKPTFFVQNPSNFNRAT